MQKQLAEFFKVCFPQVISLEYFSDGCAGQYKNLKNFLNLCHHLKDFNLSASWSFFATSHDRSPCDGVGSPVKCKLTNASLTAPVDSPILSIQAANDYCSTYISGITFFHLFSSDIEAHCQMLKNRYNKGKTVRHQRIPLLLAKYCLQQ